MIVCGLLPVQDHVLNLKVVEYNHEVDKLLLNYNSQVTLSYCRLFWSNNISQNDLKQFYVTDDKSGIHINNRGMAVLASSIKYSLASVFDVTIKKRTSPATNKQQRRV